MTRDEHLVWAKDRALQYISHEGANVVDSVNAISSLFSDLAKWEGGRIYGTQALAMLSVALLAAGGDAGKLRRIIEQLA